MGACRWPDAEGLYGQSVVAALFWPEQCRRCWLQFHIGKVSSTWTSAFVLDTDPSDVGMGTVLSQMGSDIQKGWTMVASCCNESQGACCMDCPSLSGGRCPSRKPKERLQASWRRFNRSLAIFTAEHECEMLLPQPPGQGAGLPAHLGRSAAAVFCHGERRLLSDGCYALQSIREFLSGSALRLSNYICTHEFVCLSVSPWLRPTVPNIS